MLEQVESCSCEDVCIKCNIIYTNFRWTWLWHLKRTYALSLLCQLGTGSKQCIKREKKRVCSQKALSSQKFNDATF